MKGDSKTGALKILILIMGAIIFLGLLLGVPSFATFIVETYPEFAYLKVPCLLVVWLSGIPFYTAIWEAFRICTRVQRGVPFCEQNARSFSRIGVFAWIDTAVYFLTGIVLFCLSAINPPVMVCLMAVELLGAIIALAAQLMGHLIRRALMLQTDVDLTI